MSRYTLGEENQWEGVDYVIHDDEGSVTCLLCKAGPMRDLRQIRQHFNGRRHSKNWCKERCDGMVKDSIPRINALGFEPWKKHVESLFRSAACDSLILDFVHESTFTTKVTAYYSKAVNQLEMYERMEALSLLELAIIKKEFHEYQASVEGDIDRRTFWDNRKTTSGSNVIVPLVMEFLTEEIYE